MSETNAVPNAEPKMLANQFAEAIAKASLHQLTDLNQTLWKAVQAKAIADDEAEALSGQLEAKRSLLKARKTIEPLRVAPRARARSNSEAWARRRRLAASGPMPPALASAFTTGELAALRIIADEVREKGSCDRTLGEIGTRAGVSIDTARRAVRQAARMGLITIEERRRYRQPSLSNIVRIISREWLSWISLGRSRWEGSKRAMPTDNKDSKSPKRLAKQSRLPAFHRTNPVNRAGLKRGCF